MLYHQHEQTVSHLEDANRRLSADLDRLSGTTEHQIAEKDRAEFELRALKEEGEKERTALGLRLKDAREEASTSQATVDKLMSDVVELREDKRTLEESVANLEHHCQVELAQQIAALSAAKGVLEQQCTDQRSELHQLVQL